ncbi:MAG: hypothetical protein ABIO79_16560 [Ferruginibacter sp.]
MKQLLLLAFLSPLFSVAQQKTHRFQNDTLYTSCGFKIYPGQTLQIGKRASDFIGFRYLSKLSTLATSLENNSVLVRELSGYGYSPTGSATINITAAIVYRDGSKGLVSFTLAFDLAIGRRLPGTSSELIVPQENLISKQQAIAMQKPALEEDTLHTSSGFKIYKGQFLQFGEATGNNGRFRYINVLTAITHSSLENKQIFVREIKGLSFSVLGNAYIDIIGSLVLKNKRTMDVELHMAFDHAIENIPGIPSELIVPDEYRDKLKKNPEVELERMETLYRSKIITKEEFEAVAKKLSAK